MPTKTIQFSEHQNASARHYPNHSQVFTANRTCTDGACLFVLGTFLIITVALACYCAGNRDSLYQKLSTHKIKEPSRDNSTVVFVRDEYFKDVQKCWLEIIYMCLLAVLFSCIFLIILRFMAGLHIWVTFGCFSLVLINGTILTWLGWADHRHGELSSMYLIMCIAMTLFTLMFVLMLFTLLKRIRLVKLLFNEAGKAVGSLPALLLQPILTVLTSAAITLITVYILNICQTTGVWVPTGGNLYMQYTFKRHPVAIWTAIWSMFAWIWLCAFAYGCQQMVIAGAVAKWFFSSSKDNLGYPILTSFGNLTKYHLGTVAFGSLLIALFNILRKAISFLTRFTDNSPVLSLQTICICCLRGLCCCCASLVEYISRNAYIVTAIHGSSFCKSGKMASQLLLSNLLFVMTVQCVGDFVLFLTKLSIVFFTCLCGWAMLQGNESIHSWRPPVALGGFIAYIISHAFIDVYEMVIDTLFICYCEDLEMNDGVSMHTSRGLLEFIETSKTT